MRRITPIHILLLGLATTLALPLFAADAPQEVRQEMMKGVRDAAKPLGQMMKGEKDFDAAAAMDSLKVFQHSANNFGDLFPEGSDSGYETEALESIWSDRAGFDAKLADFGAAVDAAIAANPQDLNGLRKAAGPVFKQCKACHEGYRADN